MPGHKDSKAVLPRAEAGLAPRRSVPHRMDRWTRSSIWLAIVANMLGDRRFHARVVTGVIGACAAASLLKNNQARPVRRAITWYNVRSQIQDVKVVQQAARVLPGDMLEAESSRPE